MVLVPRIVVVPAALVTETVIVQTPELPSEQILIVFTASAAADIALATTVAEQSVAEGTSAVIARVAIAASPPTPDIVAVIVLPVVIATPAASLSFMVSYPRVAVAIVEEPVSATKLVVASAAAVPAVLMLCSVDSVLE